ncbi:protein kinase [Myxococcota bacterium]|nr:protein kinase [Myxococcota bacterium]MBU1535756.1 protein kinase [Myxococcota bacterium]
MEHDPYLGKIISGKYRIIDFIGQGGMGFVYLAEHESLPRRFAIKILKSDYLENDEFVERFRREAIAASRVVHPNIVYISDFGRIEEGNFYIVMEYLEGEGLDRILETHGKIPLSRALPVLVQIADAMDHAHAVGVVHRDLKAENVLLTREHGKKDVVKLLDFGIARIMLPSFMRTRITSHGQVFGTPEYMSPEQASDGVIDGRSDIYSLGCLAYELLTGAPPFYYEDATQTLEAHLVEEPVAPSSRMPDQPIPKLLDGIILKCLAKKPEERYQTGGKLKAELLRARNLLTQMVSEMVKKGDIPHALPVSLPEDLLSELTLEAIHGNVVELRSEFQGIVKEILFVFIGDGFLDSSYSHHLDILINLESELSVLTSSIALKEQEFERIREEYGKQESNLRYAHLDLRQEFRNCADAFGSEGDAGYLADLQFQIEALANRLAQVSVLKRNAIERLNTELATFRDSLEEREMEISHHYAQMQGIIEKTRRAQPDGLTLRYSMLLGKYDHLRGIIESLRRKAGSQEQ